MNKDVSPEYKIPWISIVLIVPTFGAIFYGLFHSTRISRKDEIHFLAETEKVRRETIRLGQDKELRLTIGYLRCHSGLELHPVIAEFSSIYPEVEISIVIQNSFFRRYSVK